MAHSFVKKASLSAVAAVGFGVAYARLFRPWQLSWGASVAEVRRHLPGDDLVEKPTLAATRAITIAAPPERIFPWLVQVGLHRAGWYSYDTLDNLGHQSARTVLPQFQHVKQGDILPMSPDGKHGMSVHSLNPPHEMIWGTPGDTTWVWLLEPRPNGTTRLITRVRSRYHWTSPTIVFSVLLEFTDIWMMRRMLLNLRERIEALEPAHESASVPDRVDSARLQGTLTLLTLPSVRAR